MIQTGKTIRTVKRGGVPFLQFPIFDGYPLVHGFSTRQGGVSEGGYASMNFSFTRGDRPEKVRENHRIFAEAVGYRPEELVLTDQVHGTEIRRVGRADTGDIYKESRRICETDGLVTDEEHVVLMTFFADCVPLIFYDPVKRAVGNAHSGWRGTVQRMGQRMTERMAVEFGSDPGDILAVIGPSICRGCYEVSEDVVREFDRSFAAKYRDRLYEKKENGHYQLDLWEANKIILMESGLKEEHICVSGLCTYEHPDELFSHRVMGDRRGNLCAVIGLGTKE